MPKSSRMTAGSIAFSSRSAGAPRKISLDRKAGKSILARSAQGKTFSQGWARAFLREGL